MSSTNRTTARSSHPSDYYITPVKDIKLFLKNFNEVVKINWENELILDPCTGGDSINDMSYPLAIQNYIGKEAIELDIDTIDIRKDSKANKITNYLLLNVDNTYQRKPSVIITNPPFRISKEIIQKSLTDVKDNGWVIMLLRLNFFGSKQRKPFWDEFMPRYVFVHHKRICFTQNGSTDSIEYAHFCWQKGNYPQFAELKVI